MTDELKGVEALAVSPRGVTTQAGPQEVILQNTVGGNSIGSRFGGQEPTVQILGR